jgi:hypothetical protein
VTKGLSREARSSSKSRNPAYAGLSEETEEEEEEEEEWMMGFEPTAFRMASGSWARAYRPTKSHCEARLSFASRTVRGINLGRGRFLVVWALNRLFARSRACSVPESRSHGCDLPSGSERGGRNGSRSAAARPRFGGLARAPSSARRHNRRRKGPSPDDPSRALKGFHRLLRGASERLRRVERPIGLREERIVERLRARGHADRHPKRK